MGENYLIDTSAVIKYINKTFPVNAINFLDTELDREVNISIVTKVALLAWEPSDPADLIRYIKFVEIASIFPSPMQLVTLQLKSGKKQKYNYRMFP